MYGYLLASVRTKCCHHVVPPPGGNHHIVWQSQLRCQVLSHPAYRLVGRHQRWQHVLHGRVDDIDSCGVKRASGDVKEGGAACIACLLTAAGWIYMISGVSTMAHLHGNLTGQPVVEVIVG